MTDIVFRDRIDAGRRLAHLLRPIAPVGVVVLGLPRGGVPVAAEVAAALGAPLHVLYARKIGAPGNPEFAIGAVAEAGATFLDRTTIDTLGLRADEVADAEHRARERLDTLRATFADVPPRPALTGRPVIIVDDGLATGATARAACRAARALGASDVWLAMPIAPTDWTEDLAGDADHFIAVEVAEVDAVGRWYLDFHQVDEDEVRHLLVG